MKSLSDWVENSNIRSTRLTSMFSEGAWADGCRIQPSGDLQRSTDCFISNTNRTTEETSDLLAHRDSKPQTPKTCMNDDAWDHGIHCVYCLTLREINNSLTWLSKHAQSSQMGSFVQLCIYSPELSPTDYPAAANNSKRQNVATRLLKNCRLLTQNQL